MSNYEENQEVFYYPFDFDRTQRWSDGQGGWVQVHVVQSVQTFWTKAMLQAIEIYGGQAGRERSLLWTYTLDQEYVDGHIRLNGIQQIAADGTALPATTFGYLNLAGYTKVCEAGKDEGGNKPWLNGISNGYGGGTSFNYVAPMDPPWFQNGQTMAPRVDGKCWYRYRVRQMKVNPGVGESQRTVYEYRNQEGDGANAGDWNPDNKEFRGHPRVRVIQYNGADVTSYTDHYFYQGNGGEQLGGCWQLLDDAAGMAGREYKTIQWRPNGSNPDEEILRSEVGYLYRDLGEGRYFVAVQSTCAYPEGASGPYTRANYEYDVYGNVVRETQLGNDAMPGDEYIIERQYIPNEARWIVNTPQIETLKDINGVVQHQTRYAYDGQAVGQPPTEGNVTEVQQGREGWDWVTTRTKYDDWGNIEIVTDTLQHATHTVYDTSSRQFPVIVTNAKNQNTKIQWDLRLGVPLTVTDANDVATYLQYDGLGRVLSVTPPGDLFPAIKYTYPTGDSISMPFAVLAETRVDAYTITPQYQRSWTIYDGLGRVIQTQSEIEDGLLVVSDAAYDAFGRPVMASLPYTIPIMGGGVYHPPDWNNQLKTVTTYDIKGRVVTVTAPDGSVTQKAYQAWNELLLDAKGHQTVYINDGLGRLIEVHEYDGMYANPTWAAADPTVTKYNHDAAGNLIRVVDALGHVITLSYDPLGRKTAMDDPSMGKWSYTYDDAGNIASQTDAEGQILTFEYDELNRVTSKIYAGTTLAEYNYDQGRYGVGRRTTMTDTSGMTSWQYDEQGRAIRETRTIAGAGTFATTQGYDAAGRVITTALPTGEVIHNTYNLRGLPETVTGLDDYLTAATYNALGQPLQQTWGNGRQTVYGYNPASQRLESLHMGDLLNLSYTYDQVGNLRTLTDAGNGGQVQTFAYDARDRLTSAQTNADGQYQYHEAYGYDAMGNIITRTYGSKTVTYTYGRKYGLQLPIAPTTHTTALHVVYFPIILREEAFRQPFAVVATSAGFRAGYDRNGNMLARVEVSGTETITYTQEWNVENRLAVVTNTVTGEATRFVYDGDGNRIARQDPTGLTVNVGAVEVESSGTQRLTTTYYFASGQRIAMRKDGEITYLHGDHLGSASLATDAGGAKVSEMRYTPFGEARFGDAPTDRRFTGQREETGIGLYDYGARFYSASVGRFVSADSIVPDPRNPRDLNRYAYAANNPLSFKDPNGHQVRPPETCGAICYTGTIGPYNIEYADPVRQPLTVKTNYAADEYYWTAAEKLPDDYGVILLYSTDFEATPKVATVYAPLGTGLERQSVWRLQGRKWIYSQEDHIAMSYSVPVPGSPSIGFDAYDGIDPELGLYGFTFSGSEFGYELKLLGNGAEAAVEMEGAGDFYVITTGEKYNTMGVDGIRRAYIQRGADFLGMEIYPNYKVAFKVFWQINLAWQRAYHEFLAWKSTEI